MASSAFVIIIGVVGGLIGYLIGTSPAGVIPAFVPEDSPLHTFPLPPWPVFRAAVGVNEWLSASALATTPPDVQVKNLAMSFAKSEITYSLALNGIFDAVGDAARPCSVVAQELALKEEAVCRYMHAGYLLGLFLREGEQRETAKYSNSPSGILLQKDVAGSLRDFVLMMNEESYTAFRAAGEKSIKSGNSGMFEAFGMEFWPLHESRPEQSAQFDRAMTSLSTPVSAAFISDWNPPSGDITICDVGGGSGTVLTTVLKHYPQMKGIVFDQPAVVKQSTHAYLKRNGISNRAKGIGGNFLASLPSEMSQCDVFLMKHILHDWADENGIKILKNIKDIAKPGSIVVLLEFVQGVHGNTMEQTTSWLDINMMGSCEFGAKERTMEQYQALFAAAGYKSTAKRIPLRDISSAVQIDTY